MKVSILKQEIQYEGKKKQEDVKALVTKMKGDIDERLVDLKKQLAEMKAKIKNENNANKKKGLEEDANRMAEEIKLLEDESKASQQFLEQGAKMDTKIELLMVDLANAANIEDWLKKFSDMCELEIPQLLVKYYNTSGVGCLDENQYPDVKVDCWQVSEEEELAAIEECELDFVWD